MLRVNLRRENFPGNTQKSILFSSNFLKKCPLPCEQTNRCVSGTCIDNSPVFGSFSCTCIGGYTGPNCEELTTTKTSTLTTLTTTSTTTSTSTTTIALTIISTTTSSTKTSFSALTSALTSSPAFTSSYISTSTLAINTPPKSVHNCTSINSLFFYLNLNFQ
jgi:hypothetical protein